MSDEGQRELRVFLDDDVEYRRADEGWIHVQTAPEVIRLLDSGQVVQEIHGRMLWPRDGITVHSGNPVGRDNIARAIRHEAGRRLKVSEDRTRGGKPRFRFEE